MALGGLSFAFDAENETPESAARRRALAEAIMGRTMSPQNVGEGFGAIASGIVANVNNSRAQEAETAGRAGANDAFSRLVSGITGGSPAYTPSGGGSAAGAANGLATAGDMNAYRNAIASIESAGSGDYAAVGPTHPRLGRALGRYQVMEANIGPWSRQVLGREVTPDEFMANPELQDAIFDGIFGQYVEQFGPEGAAQAWFAGPGGVGKMDRQDSLGTSVSAYTDKFRNTLGGASAQPPVQVAALDDTGIAIPGITGGAPEPATAAPQSMPAQTAQAPQMAPQASPAPMQQPMAQPKQVAQGPSLEELLMVSQNPWLTDSQRSALNAMIEQQLQQRDPRYQQQLRQGDVDLRRSEFELDQMMNPGPGPEPMSPEEMAAWGIPEGSGSWTLGSDGVPKRIFEPESGPTSVQEYEYYVQQAEAQGQQPVPYVEWDNARKQAGAISIDARNMGSIPAGYRVEYDEGGNPVQMSPIPGSPAAMEAESAAAQAGMRQDQTGRYADVVLQDLDQALGLTGSDTTGLLGTLLQNVPGTNARNLDALLTTIRSNIGFDRLQAMREASPTGGALGAVSDFENRQLQSTLGNLEQSQTEDQLRRNLERVRETYLDIIHGPGNRPGEGDSNNSPRPAQSQANPQILNGTTGNGITWSIVE